MKSTRQKFQHYAFQAFLIAFGTATASLIVYSIVVAFQYLPHY